MKRAAVAMGLALIAGTISATFSVLTLFCGAMQQSASVPGGPQEDARCVSALHPVGVILAVFSAVSIWAIWSRVPLWAFGLGVAACPLGILSGFSGGFFTIIPGILLLMAGIAAMERRAPRKPDLSRGAPLDLNLPKQQQ